jgi:hypothetical protein
VQHGVKFVVVASDGLWDVMTNQQVVHAVRCKCARTQHSLTHSLTHTRHAWHATCTAPAGREVCARGRCHGGLRIADGGRPVRTASKLSPRQRVQSSRQCFITGGSLVLLQTALKRWQQAKAADNVTILVVFFSYQLR